jgi:exopolyphosphatase/guanosine-5'-triphosphate,3'-diphosphate pyrophosphatase
MRRVLVESRRARHGLAPDAVHDLRVALRRCRSMASGLMSVDPHPAWPTMRRAGRKLFRRLGELRDTQVLLEWLQKLATEEMARRLRTELTLRENLFKERAQRALARFDRARWKHWSQLLPLRADRLALDGPVFQILALEQWLEARALHRRALRNRSQAAWHALRIGLKRFRYTVENFLPSRHARWGQDLKQLQDLLGEMHDLDVLAGALAKAGELRNPAVRARWRKTLDRERQARLEEYRRRMLGRASLWHAWREGLPSGDALEAASLARIAAWAEFRDEEFPRARRIAQLACELFDGLAALHLPGPYGQPRARMLLEAAALMHNVARSRGPRGHHKAAFREIRKMTLPLGWTEEERDIVAQVARYHRGATPSTDHPSFAALGPAQRDTVLHLGGILRLAAAFDFDRSGEVRHLAVSGQPDGIQIAAQGYTGREVHARVLTAERHMLERALRRPILIRPRTAGPRRVLRVPPRVPLTAVVA